MEKIWLSVKECKDLLSCSYPTIYRKIYNNKVEYRYIDGVGKGGNQIQVLLSSLPTAAQDKFNNVNQDKINLQHMLENYTGKEREKADFKLRAVIEYKHSPLPISEFLQEFNENYDSDVTRSQLLRWQRKFKEGGFERLIDTRGKNSHQSTISDEAWEFFKDLYLNQNQRSVQICYDYTKKRFNDIPSVSAFRRRVKTIPKNVLIYCRDGEKAFNDKCIPDMSRDVTTISSNEIWCSDHHRIDVFTKDATGQKITRMWLTIFQDVRSMKIVGAICRDAEPNATVIKMCLKQAIEKYGIPERVYFDNGKDYRSKYFSKDFPLSLVNQLGIKSMYAQKYHGQSKICERTFRTFEDRFGKMFNTYTGRDAKKRPERMQIPNKDILKLAPDMDVFIKLLYEWIDDFNNRASKGKTCQGKTPNQVYYENLHTKTVLHDNSILNILCGTFEERTITKNGISFMTRQFTHEALLSHIGEKVIINYSPENVDKLNVFDMDVNAICVAIPKVVTPYGNATDEDFKRANAKKKKARKLVREMKPIRDKDIMSLVAEEQFERLQYQKSKDNADVLAVTDSDNDTTDVAIKINPVMSKQNEILNASENHRKEDTITDRLIKKWALGG
ncbi:MAG: DDE-type integrase/transposase/recombinase [Lachnospiraceae bacterium]|nr:DDE-type integrase/transposase/recombinase [Lachnospiraceae bacterium]